MPTDRRQAEENHISRITDIEKKMESLVQKYEKLNTDNILLKKELNVKDERIRKLEQGLNLRTAELIDARVQEAQEQTKTLVFTEVLKELRPEIQAFSDRLEGVDERLTQESKLVRHSEERLGTLESGSELQRVRVEKLEGSRVIKREAEEDAIDRAVDSVAHNRVHRSLLKTVLK